MKKKKMMKNICADTQGFIILLWLSKHDEWHKAWVIHLTIIN